MWNISRFDKQKKYCWPIIIIFSFFMARHIKHLWYSKHKLLSYGFIIIIIIIQQQ